MTSGPTDWIKRESRYVMQTYRRQPLVLDHGIGTQVWDSAGNRYLDFVAGIAVNALGHSPPAVVKAIKYQAEKLLHVSNLYYTEPQIELAQLLVDHSPCDRVYFANSGAEANEGAIKLARRFGTLHRDGAYEIITALDSFHGRTLATLTATGKPSFHEQFDPLPAGFVHVPWNDVAAIKDATTHRTVAIMLEPVQGEGGVFTPNPGYLLDVQRWCRSSGLVFILDEIQTGIGRLGSLFGHEEYGVEPDIMTLAKALGSGLPIGALLAKQEYCVFDYGDHGSTFGGGPLACAAALAGLRYIFENDVISAGKRAGALLRAGLERLTEMFPFVTEVRGKGLLLAIQFDSDIAGQVATEALDRGLLVNPVRPNSLRFMPPLTVSDEEIDEALSTLKSSIAAVVGNSVPVRRRQAE